MSDMKRLVSILMWVFLVLSILVCLYPIVCLITNSLVHPQELTGGFPSFFKTPSAIQYYNALFRNSDFLRALFNSLFLSVSITVGQILVAIPAAFVLAKYPSRLGNAIFALYLVLVLLPYQVVQLPHYLLLDELGLLNTHRGVIFPQIFSALGVCILRQGMGNVDDKILDAARIDGCGDFRLLVSMVIPDALPTIVTAAFLVFLDTWNMVEAPLIFINDAAKYPLSVLYNSISASGTNFAIGIICLIIPFLLFGLVGERLKEYLEV